MKRVERVQQVGQANVETKRPKNVDNFSGSYSRCSCHHVFLPRLVHLVMSANIGVKGLLMHQPTCLHLTLVIFIVVSLNTLRENAPAGNYLGSITD